MFTDRFIKLPVHTYSLAQEALTGVKEWQENWRKVLPMEICEYGPTNSSEDENCELTYTAIHLKCGDSFMTSMHIDDFERLLNTHASK